MDDDIWYDRRDHFLKLKKKKNTANIENYVN